MMLLNTYLCLNFHFSKIPMFVHLQLLDLTYRSRGRAILDMYRYVVVNLMCG